jgi:hypothetical protein
MTNAAHYSEVSGTLCCCNSDLCNKVTAMTTTAASTIGLLVITVMSCLRSKA